MMLINLFHDTLESIIIIHIEASKAFSRTRIRTVCVYFHFPHCPFFSFFFSSFAIVAVTKWKTTNHRCFYFVCYIPNRPRILLDVFYEGRISYHFVVAITSFLCHLSLFFFSLPPLPPLSHTHTSTISESHRIQYLPFDMVWLCVCVCVRVADTTCSTQESVDTIYVIYRFFPSHANS